ncbi:MAG: LexA family transcriptional regulator [Halomonadaceae bacterium]|nr:MAG: LexA family transcriptional regulator [Halomonadaceae bacterium]
MEQMSLSNDSFEPGRMRASTVAPASATRARLIQHTDFQGMTSPAPQSEEPKPVQGGNVTEIILPKGQVEHFQLLLPMLTQLTQEKRWLAWIDPPTALVQQWQQHRGIVQGQLLVLRSSAQYSAETLAERALEAGTCHAVILWTKGLGRQSFNRLEQASANGASHGIVLRRR